MKEYHIVSLYFLFSFRLNSMINIQFLYYNKFGPIFLAIIMNYLTFSTFSSIIPQLANVYKGGRSCCFVQNRFVAVHSADSLLTLAHLLWPFVQKISSALYWKHEIKNYEFCAEKIFPFFRVRIYWEITKRNLMVIVVILQRAETGSVGVELTTGLSAAEQSH